MRPLLFPEHKVRCPACGQRQGQPCRAKTRVRSHPHDERMARVRRLGDKDLDRRRKAEAKRFERLFGSVWMITGPHSVGWWNRGVILTMRLKDGVFPIAAQLSQRVFERSQVQLLQAGGKLLKAMDQALLGASMAISPVRTYDLDEDPDSLDDAGRYLDKI